jgi:hypothetical protein
LAYLLLKHLALATEDEVGNDPELNFGFVHDRFRGTNLETIFYEKLMQSENKEAFTEAFAKILSRETEGISKALDKIYPRPDPTIKQIEDRMSFSIGSLGALKILLGAPKAVNAQVGPDEQLKPEHLDVLIRVVYGQIGLELKNIQNAIIHVSEKAGANKLFFCLD